jgi:hypothetical protein
MLITLLLLWTIGCILTWGSIQLDTLRYGFPRTTQLEYAVGHGRISHFIATNQDGQVYVVEIPEDDPARSQLLIGPHIQGKDADLAPVQLAFQGNPQHPDLLVEIQDIGTRFHNLGNVYALSTTS